MTTPRSKVAESLAARGRPLEWANEQESAELAGYEFGAFKRALPDLEARGFPPICPSRHKRHVPSILAFNAREVDRIKGMRAQSHAANEESNYVRPQGQWGAPSRSPVIRPRFKKTKEGWLG